MRDPAWGLIVGLGAVIAAGIVVLEPASMQRTSRNAPWVGGMGRADDNLDDVWGLSVGQETEVEIEATTWRMSRLEDGRIQAVELRPDGDVGRVGVLSQRGRVEL